MEISKTLLKNLPKNQYLSLISAHNKERSKTIASLVFTLVSIALFGLFAINPTLSTIADLTKQLDDSKFVDNQLQEKLTNLSLLQEKYRSLQPDLPVILTAIPKIPDVPTFVAKIQSLVTSSHVSLKRLDTFQVDLVKNQESPSDLASAFNFSLDVSGSYPTITAFVTALSKLDRIITIEGLSITKNSASADSISLSIRGKAYFKN